MQYAERNRPWARILQRTLILAVVLSALGCSSRIPELSGETVNAVQWPPAPEPARIRHLYSFSSAVDLGIKRGFFSRLLGSGKAVNLRRPVAVVAAAGGVMYVADLSGALFLFDPKSRISIRQSESSDGPLLSPVSLTLGENDSVYVADSQHRKIFVYDRELRPVRVLASGFQRPTGIFREPATGHFVVVDAEANRVLVLGSDGRMLREFGDFGESPDNLHTPTHLWVADDRILVTDALNFRVGQLTMEGELLGSIGRQGDSAGSFARPKGVARDSQGHIYVVDAMFGNVQIFDDRGRLLLIFGASGGLEPGGFSLPNGIYIDGQDRIYVADTYHSRIQVFQYLEWPNLPK